METVCNNRIVVSSSTQTHPTSTHIVWRPKRNFLKLLNLSEKKIKMLFTGLGRFVLGEVLRGAQDLELSFSQYGPPSP